MSELNIFTDWLLSAWTVISSVIFTGWGFIGTFLFCVPIVRKLVKIFKNTF